MDAPHAFPISDIFTNLIRQSLPWHPSFQVPLTRHTSELLLPESISPSGTHAGLWHPPLES